MPLLKKIFILLCYYATASAVSLGEIKKQTDPLVSADCKSYDSFDDCKNCVYEVTEAIMDDLINQKCNELVAALNETESQLVVADDALLKNGSNPRKERIKVKDTLESSGNNADFEEETESSGDAPLTVPYVTVDENVLGQSLQGLFNSIGDSIGKNWGRKKRSLPTDLSITDKFTQQLNDMIQYYENHPGMAYYRSDEQIQQKVGPNGLTYDQVDDIHFNCQTETEKILKEIARETYCESTTKFDAKSNAMVSTFSIICLLAVFIF